jgi:uncharacterized YigZ family protein
MAFYTVFDTFSETLEVKQSKFIAFLVPYADFTERLEALKMAHPKARHFVTAFRNFNAHHQIVEGSSDDGEPRGTSGKPTLAVLQGHDLIESAIITVRYFGGTKLGTGGLVRAYSDAANLVIASAKLTPFIEAKQESVVVPYPLMGKVTYALEACGVTVLHKVFEPMQVQCIVQGPQSALDTFHAMVDEWLH